MDSMQVFYVLSLLAVLISGLPNNRKSLQWPKGNNLRHTGSQKGCKRCKMDTETQEQIQVELIKQRILEGLGLKSAPKIFTRPKMTSLPEPMITSLKGSALKVETLPGEENQAFILPQGSNDSESTSRLLYKLSPNIMRKTFHSVQFWSKQSRPNLSMQFSFWDDLYTSHSLSFDALAMEWKEGWAVYNLTEQLQIFLTNYKSSAEVPTTIWLSAFKETEGENIKLSNKEHTPFLSVGFSTDVQHRPKRSLNCQKGSKRCCLRPLTVNFRDIGWSDFILQPPSIEANVCAGDCNYSVPSTRRGFFRRLKQHIRASKGLKLCCSGRRFSGVVILYFDGEGDSRKLYRKFVDNLIIEECWCG